MLTGLHLNQPFSLQMNDGKLCVSIEFRHLRHFERFIILWVEKVFLEEFRVDTAAHAISNVRSKYLATHTFQQWIHSRLFSDFSILSFFPNERHVCGKDFEGSEFHRGQLFLNGAMFIRKLFVDEFEWLLFLLSHNASCLFLFDGSGRRHYYVVSKRLVWLEAACTQLQTPMGIDATYT